MKQRIERVAIRIHDRRGKKKNAWIFSGRVDRKTKTKSRNGRKVENTKSKKNHELTETFLNAVTLTKNSVSIDTFLLKK